jgi:hypothetical protein
LREDRKSLYSIMMDDPGEEGANLVFPRELNALFSGNITELERRA